MKRENQEEILGRHIIYMVGNLYGESNRMTNHLNDFMVLMQNYDTALGYIDTAAESSGSSMEKYEAYTDSLAGKLEGFQNAFQSLSTAVFDSDIFKGLIDGGTAFLNVLTQILSVGNGLPAIFAAIGGTAFFKNLDWGKSFLAA